MEILKEKINELIEEEYNSMIKYMEMHKEIAKHIKNRIDTEGKLCLPDTEFDIFKTFIELAKDEGRHYTILQKVACYLKSK